MNPGLGLCHRLDARHDRDIDDSISATLAGSKREVERVNSNRVQSSRENESGATVEPEGVREGEGESREENAELWYVLIFDYELHLVQLDFSFCLHLVKFVATLACETAYFGGY